MIKRAAFFIKQYYTQFRPNEQANTVHVLGITVCGISLANPGSTCSCLDLSGEKHVNTEYVAVNSKK